MREFKSIQTARLCFWIKAYVPNRYLSGRYLSGRYLYFLTYFNWLFIFWLFSKSDFFFPDFFQNWLFILTFFSDFFYWLFFLTFCKKSDFSKFWLFRGRWVGPNTYRPVGRGLPHSMDFSIVRFFKNMNSSHRKVHPLYSTVFTVDKKWVLYCIFILIGQISHTAVPRLTWLWFFLKYHVNRNSRYENH